MPKPRTKRTDLREQRKRKRRDDAEEDRPKRSRRDDNEDAGNGFEAGAGDEQQQPGGEKEFFGMLADEEQEYFRRADELLELNQFPQAEDREIFLESVWREAQGKELKLASSQSCSRLMERLIQLSNTSQKKHLFEAFAGHFLSLVQHRFASHCCEALFLRSAGVVTQELGSGFVLDTKGTGADDQRPEASMEDLYLATLDELEGHLGYLITDRFASHTLRALLLVLSGRPLDDASSRTLIKSKKKEKISVAGAQPVGEVAGGIRAVPESFHMATKKIIQDSTSEIDATSLRVLATHPIGNPTLQLLLELELSMSKADQAADKTQPSLLLQLLPGAPQTLSEDTSEAALFINSMVYDQIGSRLVETIITHAPGKIFKALNQNIFLPRISSYVRNDVSSYAAIRVLNRLGKEDLAEAVDKIAPTVPQLVAKGRFNVLKTLFERCSVRGIQDEIKKLMKGLREGCGTKPEALANTLCALDEEENQKDKKNVQELTKNTYAIRSHGAQLLTTLLSIPGPSKGVQESLLALTPEKLLKLATLSMPTVTLLTTAFAASSANPAFHKTIVGKLSPHIPELATSQYGHNLVLAIVEVPSKGKERSVPFHMKEAVMAQLGTKETELRDSWMGRSVWRGWKGDMWKTRRADWKAWMREVDATVEKPAPWLMQQNRQGKDEEKRNTKNAEEENVAEPQVEEREVDTEENGLNQEEASADGENKKKKKDKKEKKDKKDKDKKDKKKKRSKEENADEAEE